ncbi:MAG TPA: glycoside hydrolase family 13 protein [Bacilli bacterium]|nr:MAG: Amylopullulanase precursor [Tenericutes bacterium ADurb.BinA124]HNZ50628.1 glycoside hydrolase family 13 protein [Bacilli bacterium]HPX83836.1 glycoside hydrolase family 13 protein [Bacilli bacterium]HQC74284.1 glycoside hydrolase family 13 protein [Bacilli bacterium]
MKNILFNPFYEKYKFPQGAIKNSDQVKITVLVIETYQFYYLDLLVKDDGNQEIKRLSLEKKGHENNYQVYQVTFSLAEKGLYWYYFECCDVYGTHFIGSNRDLDGVLTDYYPTSWQLLVHQAFIGELNWFKGKVMYQIMVDRFFKVGQTIPKPHAIMHDDWCDVPHFQATNGVVLNNDFFGGNLQGVIAKLDYLQSLNVGVIYLNPIFEAFSNHKYDTGDYRKIDSMLGTEADFQLLCAKAKEKGIAIIFDGVYNHTGDDSIYFNKYQRYPELGAYQSRASKYYRWYKFINWPNQYACWWGFKTLPAVNQQDPYYQQFITGKHGVLDKWLTQGAKGVRLDVIDELDNTFLDKIYAAVKANDPENIVIGEVWEDASTKHAYNQRRRYLWGKQVDSVMNYPLKKAIIDFIKHDNLTGLVIQIRHLINNYPKHVIDSLMNHLGTHDTVRLLTNFAPVSPDQLRKEEQAYYHMSEAEYHEAVRRLKMATAIQFTLPGVPSIFYGDETGMEGFRDPFCRRTIDWDHINQDLFNWYQKLGKIRHLSVFVDGQYYEESTSNNVFAFSRKKDHEKILTIVNNNHYDISYHLGEGFDLIDELAVSKKVNVPKKTAKIIKLN